MSKLEDWTKLLKKCTNLYPSLENKTIGCQRPIYNKSRKKKNKIDDGGAIATCCPGRPGHKIYFNIKKEKDIHNSIKLCKEE